MQSADCQVEERHKYTTAAHPEDPATPSSHPGTTQAAGRAKGDVCTRASVPCSSLLPAAPTVIAAPVPSATAAAAGRPSPGWAVPLPPPPASSAPRAGSSGCTPQRAEQAPGAAPQGSELLVWVSTPTRLPACAPQQTHLRLQPHAAGPLPPLTLPTHHPPTNKQPHSLTAPSWPGGRSPTQTAPAARRRGQTRGAGARCPPAPPPAPLQGHTPPGSAPSWARSCPLRQAEGQQGRMCHQVSNRLVGDRVP